MERPVSLPGLAVLLALAGCTAGEAPSGEPEPPAAAGIGTAAASAETADGSAKSYYWRGVDREEGRGVAQSYEEAARLYRKAAGMGHAGAQNALGDLYWWGRGVERDYAEAVRLFRQAAAQGRLDARTNLGLAYELGRGVPENHAKRCAGTAWLPIRTTRAPR